MAYQVVTWNDVHLNALNVHRTVRILVPEAPINRVIYVHDAQNVFLSGQSFSGYYWGVDERYGDWARDDRLRHVAVVGVDHGGVSRYSEYSPWPAEEFARTVRWVRSEDGGLAARWADDLLEVKARVETEFRFAPKPQNCALGGSSMGAISSMYIALRNPDQFGSILAFSPAIWFAPRAFQEFILNQEYTKVARLFLAVGTEESSDPGIPGFPRLYRDDCLDLAERLKPILGPRLQFSLKTGCEHSEKSWAQWFPEAVDWLFS